MEDLRLGREDGGSVVAREDSHRPTIGERIASKKPVVGENDLWTGRLREAGGPVQRMADLTVWDGGAHPGWRYGMASSSTTRDYWHEEVLLTEALNRTRQNRAEATYFEPADKSESQT